MRRFFLPFDQVNCPLPTITGSDARHISKVLRMGKGDRVLIFDGSGMEYEAEIIGSGPEGVTLKIIRSFKCRKESKLQITVAQALLKDRKMDGLIRQLTELGISRWIPFPSKRSVPTPSGKRMGKRYERWEKIAREAVKQCERGKIPEITVVDNLDRVLSMGTNSDEKLIFYENEPGFLTSLNKGTQSPLNIMIIIGPEGGFESGEIDRARKKGFIPIGMGPRILRAETATISACTLVQYVFGDMG